MDVNVIYQNLPTSIKGYTVSCPDDTYTVVLNARHTMEQQIRAYWHELDHIKEGDFEKESADRVEAVAHEMQYPSAATLGQRKDIS